MQFWCKGESGQAFLVGNSLNTFKCGLPNSSQQHHYKSILLFKTWDVLGFGAFWIWFSTEISICITLKSGTTHTFKGVNCNVLIRRKLYMCAPWVYKQSPIHPAEGKHNFSPCYMCHRDTWWAKHLKGGRKMWDGAMHTPQTLANAGWVYRGN